MKIDLVEFQNDISQSSDGSYKVESMPSIWIDRLIKVYESFDEQQEGVTLAAPLYAVIKNRMSDLNVSKLTINEDDLMRILFCYLAELKCEKSKRNVSD